jgi:hypothetical protein
MPRGRTGDVRALGHYCSLTNDARQRTLTGMSLVCAVWLACVVLLLTASRASAQDSPPPVSTVLETPTEATRREPTRLYVGMWTLHLKRDTVALNNNWLIGFAHRGFFGATFMNSFGRRGYAAGIQRTVASSTRGPLKSLLGIRVGAVSGYDGRFMRIARHTPVLPLISVYSNVDIGRVGVEVAYTIVVVSVALSYRVGG